MDFSSFNDSDVSSNIAGLLTQRQFYEIYDEVGLKRNRKQDIKKLLFHNQPKSDVNILNSTFDNKQQSKNKYLDQYLSWKESQPISLKLRDTIKKTPDQTKIKSIEESIDEMVNNRTREIDLELYSYLQNTKPPKTEEIAVRKQYKVQKIQPIFIQNKRQNINNVQMQTMTGEIEEELAILRQNQEKLKRSYQSFIQCPPKQTPTGNSNLVEMKNSNVSKQSKFSSPVKSHLIDLSPFDLFLKTRIQKSQEKEKEQSRPKSKEKVFEKSKTSLKKEKLQQFLKTTLENAGSKTIQQLSQDHKRKVYDFLYNK